MQGLMVIISFPPVEFGAHPAASPALWASFAVCRAEPAFPEYNTAGNPLWMSFSLSQEFCQSELQ